MTKLIDQSPNISSIKSDEIPVDAGFALSDSRVKDQAAQAPQQRLGQQLERAIETDELITTPATPVSEALSYDSFVEQSQDAFNRINIYSGLIRRDREVIDTRLRELHREGNQENNDLIQELTAHRWFIANQENELIHNLHWPLFQAGNIYPGLNDQERLNASQLIATTQNRVSEVVRIARERLEQVNLGL